MTTTAPAPSRDATTEQVVRARRGLPGSRAVVGAFLVVVAALGTFGAYLRATAPPTTTYLVATTELAVGQVLTAGDVADGLRGEALDLPATLAGSAVAAADADALVGRTVLAPLGPGDLLRAGDLATAATTGVTLSLAVPAERALGGDVAAGERLDVLATFPSTGGGEETRVVARDVVVSRLAVGSEGLDGTRLVLTVQVADLATAQRLQHAADVARVALVRGGVGDSPAPVTSATRSAAASDDEVAP